MYRLNDVMVVLAGKVLYCEVYIDLKLLMSGAVTLYVTDVTVFPTGPDDNDVTESSYASQKSVS